MGDVALGFSDAIRSSPYGNWAEFQRQKRMDERDDKRAAMEERVALHGMRSKDEDRKLREREIVSGEASARHAQQSRDAELALRERETASGEAATAQNIAASQAAMQHAAEQAKQDAETHGAKLKSLNQQIEAAEYEINQRGVTEERAAELHKLNKQRMEAENELTKAQTEHARLQTNLLGKPVKKDRDVRVSDLNAAVLNRTARFHPELGSIPQIYAEADARAAAAYAQATYTDKEGNEHPIPQKERQRNADAARSEHLNKHAHILRAAAKIRGDVERLVDIDFTPESLSTISDEQLGGYLTSIGLDIPPPSGGSSGLIGPATSGTKQQASTNTPKLPQPPKAPEYPFNNDGSNPLWGSLGNAGLFLGRAGSNLIQTTAGGVGTIFDTLAGQYGSTTGAERGFMDPKMLLAEMANQQHNARVAELLPVFTEKSRVLDNIYGAQADLLQHQMQTATGSNLELLQRAFQQHAIKYEKEKEAMESEYFNALYPGGRRLIGR